MIPTKEIMNFHHVYLWSKGGLSCERKKGDEFVWLPWEEKKKTTSFIYDFLLFLFAFWAFSWRQSITFVEKSFLIGRSKNDFKRRTQFSTSLVFHFFWFISAGDSEPLVPKHESQVQLNSHSKIFFLPSIGAVNTCSTMINRRKRYAKRLSICVRMQKNMLSFWSSTCHVWIYV